jgi:hypothetical protein
VLSALLSGCESRKDKDTGRDTTANREDTAVREKMKMESADTDSWTVAEGSYCDKPTIIRYRPGLVNSLGDQRYPRRLTVTWEYEETDPSGMPSKNQNRELQDFEDSILNAVDPERLAILSFVFTRAGLREWHFYISDVNEVGKRINEALSEKPGLPINLEVNDDPDWEELAKVLDQCEERE